jgi:hypothetical protein
MRPGARAAGVADRRGAKRRGSRNRDALSSAGQAAGTGRSGGGSGASPSAARRRPTACGPVTAPSFHDSVRVVQEPIADGVGQRGLSDVIVPLGRGELARDDRGAAPIAILENLEQVAALLVLRRGQAPVLEEEDVHPRQPAEEPAVGAVGAREAEVSEQAGGPAVVGAVAAAAGLVGEGTGDGRRVAGAGEQAPGPRPPGSQAQKLLPVPVAPVTRTCWCSTSSPSRSSKLRVASSNRRLLVRRNLWCGCFPASAVGESA